MMTLESSVSDAPNCASLMIIIMMTLEVSSMFPEFSITLPKNSYSTDITHDDHHHDCIFIVQATK
jgi:hypothetical protein